MSRRTPRDPISRRNRRNLMLLAALGAIVLMPPPFNFAVVGLLLGAGMLRIAGGGGRFQGLLGARARPALPSGAVELGVSADGSAVTVSDEELAAHGLILGASGSGKSTTLVKLLSAQIERGRPVIAIDLKGSPELAQQLAQSAARAGRRLRVWSPDGPELWNPLANGNATELKDKLIATERFTEPHYQRAAERYVQNAIKVLQEAEPGRAPTIADVVEMMDPGRLAASLRKLPRARADEIQQYLDGLERDQLSAIRGLGTRLAIMTESHTGAFLRDGPTAVDLRSALDGGDVVLFSLNSSRYGGLAAQLGTLAIQDLVTAAGERYDRISAAASGDPRPPQATVAIDEFSVLPGPQVLQLIARSRGAGIGVLLVTQEQADFDRNAPGLRDQILGNTALKLIHRQDVPASARAAAELAGTVKGWEHTFRSGLFGGPVGDSRRVVDRFIVEPTTIQRFGTGQLLKIRKVPDARADVVRVTPPSRAREGPER